MQGSDVTVHRAATLYPHIPLEEQRNYLYMEVTTIKDVVTARQASSLTWTALFHAIGFATFVEH